METLLIIAPFILVFFAAGGVICEHLSLALTGIILLFAMSILAVIMYLDIYEKPTIIQKSSDSDWELSNNYSIKSDTCITEIKIINQADTVYPTTCYKVFKRDYED